MQAQAQVKRTLSAPAALAFVQEQLASGAFRHRTALADAVCAHFSLQDARGTGQRSGCLKALRELAAHGHFTLPAALTTPGPRVPRRLAAPVPVPAGVPAEVGDVDGLRLVLVTTEAERRIWTELMIDKHPRGAGPLVGRQLRYLVGSTHGWLGGLGFGAAAVQLAPRDRWIGWTVAQRWAHLDRVVGLSRFLIRPQVACHNLASRVLGLGLQTLSADFARRYGYPPWRVESFADRAVVRGTVYRASNWIRVGQTCGRGRQDRARRATETIKDIYLYPLDTDFRGKMGVPADGGRSPLGRADGVDTAAWADKEFDGAPLGDARLSRRLVESARMKAEDPGAAFTRVAAGDLAAVKGCYRLIDSPDADAVSPATILAPHRERTVRRLQAQRTVLVIQDGTDLDYTRLAECDGLGVIGTNQTGARSRGLHLHSLLAVTPTGSPLGVLDARCHAPQPRAAGAAGARRGLCRAHDARAPAAARRAPHEGAAGRLGRPRARADAAAGDEGPRVVPADHDRLYGGGAGPHLSALVLSALADRRLASRAQVWLPHRRRRPRHRRAPHAGRRDQSGDRLAHHADDAARPGDARPAPRRGVLRSRPPGAPRVRQETTAAAPAPAGGRRPAHRAHR